MNMISKQGKEENEMECHETTKERSARISLV